jgi:ATP synthase protein I
MGEPPHKPTGGAGQGARESFRRAGPYLDASYSLVGAVGFWTLVGYWLDGKLSTRPWLLVAGSLLGTGLGFYLFFKALAAIGRRPPGER